MIRLWEAETLKYYKQMSQHIASYYNILDKTTFIHAKIFNVIWLLIKKMIKFTKRNPWC